jgi:hypothetical protein
MAQRGPRARRRLALLVAAAIVVVLASLVAGVIYGAHRDPAYRRSVNASFAAEAGVVLLSSNLTGRELAQTLAHPGSLGRVLLAARLVALQQDATSEAEEAGAIASPPPDLGAANVIIDTLRLRADAVRRIASTLEGLLGLTPSNPVGSALGTLHAARPVQVRGAKALLRYAGEELVLADHTYAGLPEHFFVASGGAILPPSAWTSRVSGRLMPRTLLDAAPTIARNPNLQASVRLVITAVETTPEELPIGHGYPVTPTRTFAVAVSIRDVGSSPAPVTAIIRVYPLNRLGRFDSGRAVGSVAAEGAVALALPTMPVVPGEHCLVTIELVRPARQLHRAGLRWARVVVVASDSPG